MEHWCNYQFGNGGLLKNLKNFMKQGAYALAVSRELSVWKWGSIVGTAKCGTNYSIYLVSGMHQVRAPLWAYCNGFMKKVLRFKRKQSPWSTTADSYTMEHHLAIRLMAKRLGGEDDIDFKPTTVDVIDVEPILT
ncbi:hypothetical protein E3N88_24025 [Mikania micrantha]|uniref:Uncharacterized protein n=1 Tax=Mikania micrantha TaxID=192012 RepID=A0A5N6NF31_9ASTR|nr:hypothetical protein E3N88_24025 [Mikania micrantha]